jgi:hypothetical protein
MTARISGSLDGLVISKGEIVVKNENKTIYIE